MHLIKRHGHLKENLSGNLTDERGSSMLVEHSKIMPAPLLTGLLLTLLPPLLALLIEMLLALLYPQRATVHPSAANGSPVVPAQQQISHLASRVFTRAQVHISRVERHVSTI